MKKIRQFLTEINWHLLASKIKRFLFMHDWIWSVAFAFFAYLFVNYGPPQVLNMPMVYFGINWLQPLIATAGIMAGLFAIARLGMWFNTRKLHDFIYGQKNHHENGPEYNNYSFTDFKKISAWQRLLLAFFFLFVLLTMALIVFLKFIPLNAPI